MHKRIVPDIVRDQQVQTIAPSRSVREAAGMMAERKIGAVLVTDKGRLVGIFTERDIAIRVVAAGRDPETTRIAEVMSRDPDTVPPGTTAFEALTMMTGRGYRHLPVVEGGEIVGIVSIRDLYDAVKDELEEEVLERDAFMFGAGYGANP